MKSIFYSIPGKWLSCGYHEHSHCAIFLIVRYHHFSNTSAFISLREILQLEAKKQADGDDCYNVHLVF